MQKKRALILVLVAVVVASAVLAFVLAGALQQPDVDRTGSLTISVTNHSSYELELDIDYTGRSWVLPREFIAPGVQWNESFQIDLTEAASLTINLVSGNWSDQVSIIWGGESPLNLTHVVEMSDQATVSISFQL